MFGFATLSLGIGALQMMLDRGELKDWFSSTEIQIEAFIAAIGLFLFIAHTATAENTFISRGLFKDRNFVVGNIFIGMIGVVLFATLALMPPMLQGLMGYPVLAAGIVTAPRGVGTWVSMLVVGRLAGRVDARWLIAIGFGLSAISLEWMANFSPQVDSSPDHLVRRDPGLRHRAWRTCRSPSSRVRHAAAVYRNEGDGVLQPDAQHRQQHRHLADPGVRDERQQPRARDTDGDADAVTTRSPRSRRSIRRWSLPTASSRSISRS